MPRFGRASRANLSTAVSDLQKIFNLAVKEFDCSVLVGHRGKKQQNEAFDGGFSTKRYPNSKHNKRPSQAVDVVPYPVDWNDLDRYRELACIVFGIASRLGIRVRCGGLFKGKFKDYPHWEVIISRKR